MEVPQVTIKQEKDDNLTQATIPKANDNVMDIKLEPVKIEPFSYTSELNNLDQESTLLEESKPMENNDKYMVDCLRESNVSRSASLNSSYCEVSMSESEEEKAEALVTAPAKSLKRKSSQESQSLSSSQGSKDAEQTKVVEDLMARSKGHLESESKPNHTKMVFSQNVDHSSRVSSPLISSAENSSNFLGSGVSMSESEEEEERAETVATLAAPANSLKRKYSQESQSMTSSQKRKDAEQTRVVEDSKPNNTIMAFGQNVAHPSRVCLPPISSTENFPSFLDFSTSMSESEDEEEKAETVVTLAPTAKILKRKYRQESPSISSSQKSKDAEQTRVVEDLKPNNTNMAFGQNVAHPSRASSHPISSTENSPNFLDFSTSMSESEDEEEKAETVVTLAPTAKILKRKYRQESPSISSSQKSKDAEQTRVVEDLKPNNTNMAFGQNAAHPSRASSPPISSTENSPNFLDFSTSMTESEDEEEKGETLVTLAPTAKNRKRKYTQESKSVSSSSSNEREQTRVVKDLLGQFKSYLENESKPTNTNMAFGQYVAQALMEMPIEEQHKKQSEIFKLLNQTSEN